MIGMEWNGQRNVALLKKKIQELLQESAFTVKHAFFNGLYYE